MGLFSDGLMLRLLNATVLKSCGFCGFCGFCAEFSVSRNFFLDTPEGVAKISLSALKSGNADRLIFRLLAAHISQV